MKQLCVVGVGYVGLVTAACFADLGSRVIALDIDKNKIDGLMRGVMPIYEPELEELVERNVQAGRLSFTTSYAEGLKESDYAFIAVGTPSGENGEADLRYVESAAQSIAKYMQADKEFHPLFIRCSENDILVTMAENLSGRIARFRFMTLRFPKRAKESLNEHKKILDTFKNRKPNAAEKEVKFHILISSELLKRILKKDEDR